MLERRERKVAELLDDAEVRVLSYFLLYEMVRVS